jgi:large subunit ribosomal protein L13
MTTQSTKAQDIVRGWHLIDAKQKVVGRLASEIAELLMGKSKPYFVRNLDCGDYVVVINAKDVVFTGRKETEKVYYRHSGYPGGFRARTAKEMRVLKPEEIIMHAVKGMLPQNKLRAKMLTRLRVSAGSEHSYEKELSR